MGQIILFVKSQTFYHSTVDKKQYLVATSVKKGTKKDILIDKCELFDNCCQGKSWLVVQPLSNNNLNVVHQ